MNWLLFLVVFMLIGFMYKGYKDGLIMTAFQISSAIITLSLAAAITPLVRNIVVNNEDIYEFVNNSVSELVNSDEFDAMTDEAQNSVVDSMPLPSALKETIKEDNNVAVYQERAVDSFREYVADFLSRLIINALVYVIAFIIVAIGVHFLAQALDVISKLPIVNEFNKTGGTLIGFIQGLLIVWLMLVIFTMISGSELGQSAMRCVDDSLLLEFIYDNNLIVKLLANFV